jgi:hypothetical protein
VDLFIKDGPSSDEFGAAPTRFHTDRDESLARPVNSSTIRAVASRSSVLGVRKLLALKHDRCARLQAEPFRMSLSLLS